MEAIYNPETWETTTDQEKFNAAAKVFVESCEQQRDRFLEATKQRDLDKPHGDDYSERIDLGLGMLNYYVFNVHPEADKFYKPVGVEVPFSIPLEYPDGVRLPDYANVGETMTCSNSPICGQTHTNPAPITLNGRVDALLEDTVNGGYFICDWKSAAQLINDAEFLQLDDQITCVPYNSEALTPEGWKTRDQLNVGDTILGYDSDSKTNKWTEVTALHDYEDAEVINLHDKKHTFSVEATPNHRWYGRRWTGSGTKARQVEWELDTQKAVEYKGQSQIYVSAPSEVDGSLDIEPDEAALIAWILTDGSLSRKNTQYKVVISQSESKYAKEIDELIERLGYSFSEAVTLPQQIEGKFNLNYRQFTWTLSSPEMRELFERAGIDNKKQDLSLFVTSLSAKSRAAFVDAGFKAEGSTNQNHGQMTFCQNDGTIKEAFRLAYYLEGHKLSRGNDKSFNIKSQSPVTDVRTLVGDSVGRKPVWCVTTKLGSWIMRQGKQITITGNSYQAALANVLNLDVRGFLYAEIRKDYPKPLEELTRRYRGRKLSTNVNQMTTPELALETIQQKDPEGYNEGLYTEYMERLVANPPKFHQRFPVIQGEAKLKNVLKNVAMEAIEMTNPDVLLYPAPSKMNCMGCAYKAPCLGMYNDEDHLYTLQTLFGKKTRDGN